MLTIAFSIVILSDGFLFKSLERKSYNSLGISGGKVNLNKKLL